MNKFIKLHDINDEEFYINISKVISMDRYSKKITRLNIDLNTLTFFECKETPEEILKKL